LRHRKKISVQKFDSVDFDRNDDEDDDKGNDDGDGDDDDDNNNNNRPSCKSTNN
jgi:hypothetical protein